ncbi:CsbD family protein [Pseudanabaena sp. UWO310]|uniref:CsbD family protein n=1 Tax=Pseudanabaena sp. UWO310 TaxID=2480795 RepID=UPI001CC207A5|nr:CsbD family protein [Pseudanabaena sp. UWO310]
MLLQICRSLLTVGLLSLFSFGLVFMLRVENLYAANPVEIIATQARFYAPATLIATVERVKAATKDIEGKVQEAIGNVTGDTKDQVMGKAKQAEADVRNATEDLKDNLKDKLKMPERIKASSKDIEGKVQEAIGNVKGDPQDRLIGKAKQAEAKTRNLLEDAKDKVKGLFE